MLNVNDLLNRKGNRIVSINPDATIYEALRVMAENDIGALLIIEHGSLKGIFSERDYARKVTLNNKSDRDTLVRDVMVTNLISVTPQNKVADCMKLMTEEHIRHLPVFENQRLAGIITIGDVVKGMIDEQKTTISELEKYIAGGYHFQDPL